MEHGPKKTIHVLEVVGNAIVGGVESYIFHMVQRMPRYGYRFTVVSPYESRVTDGLRRQGCQVYITNMEDDPSWRSIQFLTELVLHERIDLIHAHLPRAQILAGLAGSLAKVPVVMTIHGMDIPSWELGILQTTGAHVNVVCQAAYMQALSLGIPRQRVNLIPNGVDLDQFRPAARPAAVPVEENLLEESEPGTGQSPAPGNTPEWGLFRKSAGIPLDAVLVGFTGRLAREKGPDMFLQLAAHVAKRNAEVHFVMVGDGPMRSELEDGVQQAGLQDRFTFAGVREDIERIFPELDILVQTSRVEGMPLTLLEGMACGLPAAAMNAGGVAELVEVGTTGYLSAVGDWAGLGDAVLQLAGDPELRRRMGEAARARVEEKFSLYNTLALLDLEFRELLAPSASRRQHSGRAGAEQAEDKAANESAEVRRKLKG